MDRGVVLAHLEVAERYVDTGGRYIDRLRETIDARARGGSDTTATQDLLRHLTTGRFGLALRSFAFFKARPEEPQLLEE